MNKSLGRKALWFQAIPFRAFAIAFLALNAIGLYWIRSEVRAGNTHGVWVDRVRPTRSAELADELTLTFSRPVADLSEIGEPLAESPFQLEPRREGHWRWRRPDRLCFILAEKLPRGRVFHLSPTPRFEELTGLVLEGEERFEVRTSELEIRKVRLESVEGPLATLGFHFDQPVAPADLLAHLEVHGISRRGDPGSTGGGELTLRTFDDHASEELAVVVEREGAPWLRVKLRKGLAGEGAELGLEEAYSLDLQLPDRFSVLSADARASNRENRCTVRIRFSERLALEQELPPLEFDPPVEGIQRHVSGNRLVVEGPFECGRSYRVRVGATILSRHGQTLGREQELHFPIPARSPGLFFPLEEGILSPEGHLELAMTVTNFTGVRLSAYRVHENNLVTHLHGNSTDYTSRALGEKEIALELPPNQVHTTLIDLDTLLASPLGIYRIEARGTDDYWSRDSSLIRITDLALNVKQERHGLLVWTTSLAGATPVQGVIVEARTSNNQILGGAVSDEDGLAHLLLPDDHPDGGVYVVTARKGQDSTFLRPDRRSWVFDAVDTSGRPPTIDIDCLFYTERGVYRPGDEIHLTGILRDGEGGIPADVPLAFTVTRPDGREIVRRVVEGPIDTQGVFHVAFETDPLGQTGSYEFAVTVADETREVGGTSALVEAFVPARIEVAAEVAEPEEETAAFAVEVDARYLFGRPAAELPVTVVPGWRRVDFTSKAFPELSFVEDGAHPSRNGEAVEGTLDEVGRARLSVAPPEEERPGLWQATVNATVTEPGSRTVSRRTSGRWDGAQRHLGLRASVGQLARVDETFTLDWRLVTPADTDAAPSPVEIGFFRVDRDYRLQRVDGRLIWQSEEQLVVIDRRESDAAASGRFELSCPDSGRYRVVGTDLETGVKTALDFRASRYDFDDLGSDGDGPESLTLELDRASYRPGELAKVRVGGAFAGTLLLTLETDQVLESRVIPFEVGGTEAVLEVPEGLRGGAFVCASLIRPIDTHETSWLPHRARGLVRLDTDHSAQHALVEIDAPERARPGERIVVRVQGDPRPDGAAPGRLHLWAVDEGILQATDHRVPDPHAHFFARRRAGITTADAYGDLLPDHQRPASLTRIGGDEDSRAERRRRGQRPTKRREAAVVWRTAVELEDDGSASLELSMPELRGALRLMAVVVEGDHYGSAEQRIELSTPVVIAASTPRFLTSNDRFKIPVRVTNTTADVKLLDLEAVVEGSLELTAPEGLSGLELAPGGEELLWFQARALGLGPIDVAFTARGEGVEEVAAQHLDVVPTAPLHQTSRLLTLRGGERAVLDPTEELLIAGLDVRLEISSTSAVELRPALQMLLRYPYGCVEQTTSRLFAIVNAGPLLGDGSGEGGESPAARAMVEAGLHRLRSMQTRDGGLAYWPGGYRSDPWGTAYAASFLVEARRGGYELEKSFLDPLVAYLSEELREGDASADHKALLCRVLAAFDRPHPGWNARLSEELEKLDTCGRANLAGAWLESGRRDRALECLPEGTIERVARPTTSGRITSGVRQKGALLAVLLDLDRDHPWIDTLAMGLMSARENGRWRNTLENSTALCALARYQLTQPPPSAFEGLVRLPGGEVLEFDSSEPAVFVFHEPAGALEIEVEGGGPAHVLLDAEGLALEELEPFDNGLRIRRRWLTPEGEELAGATLNVGDLVVVEVSVEALELPPGSRRVGNLAIVDPLPAGLEVENPRLASSVAVIGTTTGSADRVEFLDDRVVIFTAASRKREVYRYALRASAIGTFTIPPIQGSSMYDPGYASLGETSTVRIEE